MHFQYSYDIIVSLMAEKRDLEKQVEQYEAELASGNKKKKKKSTIRYILNISLVLIVTAVAITLTLWGNVETIWNNLIKCNVYWLLAVVGVMTLAMLNRSFILYCFARLFTRNYKFHQSIEAIQRKYKSTFWIRFIGSHIVFIDGKPRKLRSFGCKRFRERTIAEIVDECAPVIPSFKTNDELDQ